MDRSAALAQLPETYAAALRLRDEHHSDKAIAEQLGITIEAVAPLLRLAAAKLDNLISTSDESLSPDKVEQEILGSEQLRSRSDTAEEENHV